jgi:hypothetical protein
MRRVLEDRPPEKRSGCEVADVLEVEERVMLECGVVDSGQVPEEVGRKPERQGDGWAGEQSERPDSADCGGNGRRDPEDE